MIIRELRDTHPRIYKRILTCQIKSGNEINNRLDLRENKSEGNFNWEKTIEGNLFWSKIANGDFSEFYKLYPETSTVLNTPTKEYILSNEYIPKVGDWIVILGTSGTITGSIKVGDILQITKMDNPFKGIKNCNAYFGVGSAIRLSDDISSSCYHDYTSYYRQATDEEVTKAKKDYYQAIINTRPSEICKTEVEPIQQQMFPIIIRNKLKKSKLITININRK